MSTNPVIEHYSSMTMTAQAVSFAGPAVTAPAVPVSDADFFVAYNWALDAAPSIKDVCRHLHEELQGFLGASIGWQREEHARNVFLLASAISDTADDIALGRAYDFSKVTGVLSFLSPVTTATQKSLFVVNNLLNRRVRKSILSWRGAWETATVNLIRALLLDDPAIDVTHSIERATRMLRSLPDGLQGCRPRIPAAFRAQDLSHHDVLALGSKLMAAHPERDVPVIVIGLRTAGSYFAPLLRAQLEACGYRSVVSSTVRPNRGIASWERLQITRAAKAGSLGVVIDEPVGTGKTFAKGVAILLKAGIPHDRVAVLVPIHRNGRDWQRTPEAQVLTTVQVHTLEPEEWFKHRYLKSDQPMNVLCEHYRARDGREVTCSVADTLNAQLEAQSERGFHARLKSVYDVRRGSGGTSISRRVLVKSVGWGWLSYHAFVAATKLQGRVPPVVTLRDGFLFCEWIDTGKEIDRASAIRHTAEYVATRANALQLENHSLSKGENERQLSRGTEELASALSAAFGKAGGILKRARIRRDLTSLQRTHQPVLIDGRMRRSEWIPSELGSLKCDFEHHGMGKHQLNLTDPAYDLAESILHFDLSAEEEQAFIAAYINGSNDCDVAGRLLLYKLLAGNWAMDRALEALNDPRMSHRHDEFNTSYIKAWNFLTSQTVRFCGKLTNRPHKIQWKSPLAVLDIDGVLDKKIFGFPSTTASGIQGVSLLHRNGIAVALNSARTIQEVREYCSAYGFCGGVAETGAYVCDVVNGTERVLVSPESMAQLDTLRSALRSIPGVFLNDDYKYSIKAHMYEKGAMVALPKIMVEQLIASLALNRLAVTRTFLDTTVVARETDKGKGLRALLDLAQQKSATTYAVGDSAPDLAMFREASYSFAPGHISCSGAARLLGAYIAPSKYQPGFLECVRQIVRHSGGKTDYVNSVGKNCSPEEKYFLKLLAIADRNPIYSAFLSAFDPMMLNTFIAD